MKMLFVLDWISQCKRNVFMKKVLIICSANSCRSIMAEGLVNHYLKGEWQAFSAGIGASRPHPLALQALQELKIDTSYLKSESIAAYWHREDIDLIITVCDSAAVRCPAFYSEIPRIHLPFKDPINYSAKSAEAEYEGFLRLREELIQKLLPLLKIR